MKSFSSLVLQAALPGLILFLVGCEKAGEPGEKEVLSAMTKGGEASDVLMKSLGGQLKAALQGGGAVEALVICEQAALPLTNAASDEFEGLRISRTTLKPRNPGNAPGERDREVLGRLAEQVKPGADPPAPLVEWTEDHAIYYRPLLIQEVCLNCHGDPGTFPPDLVTTLAGKYPEDKATGYSLGDLRGVIRVEMERSSL